MKTIDLETLTHGRVRNLTGHERGLEARAAFNLEAFDATDEEVEVRIPEYLDSLTTSFFQGMFASSIAKHGSKFLQRYHFSARPAIMEQVLRGIDRVQTVRGSALG